MIWFRLKDAKSDKKPAAESNAPIMYFNEMSKGRTTEMDVREMRCSVVLTTAISSRKD